MDGLFIKPPERGAEFLNESSVANQAGHQNIHGSFFAGPVNNYHGSSPLADAAQEKAQLSLAVLQKLRSDRLQALDFGRQRSRYNAVKEPHSQTCAWVLSRPEYLDWLDDEQLDVHNGFLWIKGKPGTGKSTLVKFIVEKMKTSNPTATTASFFFNARGEDLEKSTIGMYRSLLLQILNKLPQLQDLLDLVEPKIDYNLIRSWDMARLTGYMSNNVPSFEWSLSELQALFTSIIQKLDSINGKLICFVDALDECEEEEVRDMVDAFEYLAQAASDQGSPSSTFRTCFSSRHYPHITIERMVSFILEDQRGHDRDLESYVNSKLRIGQNERAESIKQDIISRSSGIFLWVVLVVQLLRRDYDRGLVHKLQERLNEIPSGLQALFDDILVRDGNLEPESILCLQFVMFARRTLKPEELYWGIRMGVEDGLDLDIHWIPSDISLEDITRYILAKSKGLVEVVTLGDPKIAEKLSLISLEDDPNASWSKTSQSVQLIHESVRQFLVGQWDRRDRYFGESESIAHRSHDRLKNCCRKYFERSLETMSGSKPVLFELPMLDYAADSVLWHASFTGQADQAQDHFHTSFQESLTHILRGPPSHASSIMLKQNDLQFLTSGLQFHPPSHKAYTSELYLTLELGATWAFRIWFHKLVPQAASDQVVREIVGAGVSKIRSTFSHHSVFLWATHLGLESVVAFYIENFDIDVNELGDGDTRALCLAAYNGDVRVVTLLLRNGADITLPGTRRLETSVHKQGRYLNSLQAAAIGGSAEVLGMLLDDEHQKLLSIADFQHAIDSAAFLGHSDAVDVLLAIGKQMDKETTDGDNRLASKALSLAVEAGNLEIVERLLRSGADVNFTDESEFDPRNLPLVVATVLGNRDILRLLIQAGADVNAGAVPYGTCLNLAVSYGDLELVQFFIEHGADIHVQWEEWGSALYIAARRGDDAMCELLLQAGADVNQAGGYFGNCLQAAVVRAVEKVVRLLLNAGADVNAEGGFHRTAYEVTTQAIADPEFPRIQKLLLDAGASTVAANGQPEVEPSTAT